jgi:outer membrane protein OmpA-like peptidoglycan-associated protein
MKIRAIFLMCILGGLISDVNLSAQESAGRYGFGVIASTIKMIGGKMDRSTVDQWAGFQLKYNYSSQVSFNANLAYGWVYPRDPGGSQFKAVGGYKTELIPFNLNINYYFVPPAKVTPFASFGAGLIVWDIRQLNNNFSVFSRGKSLKGGRLNAMFTGGLGIEFLLTQDYAFNLQCNYNRILKGNEDTIGFGDDGNNGVAELRFGVCHYFGGFKDQDKDGIEDKFDQDPLNPEDFDGFQDSDGAPDTDNDGDGIPDFKDKAPNKPEDIDGFQDDDGVPDPDNDGDKIPDVKDKCPNIAEDMDGFEDQDGCPDFDNDKDGIPDSVDQCPNWAEDFNGYMDEDGCPDEIPAQEQEPELIETGENIILKGVNFKSGSTLLNPESYHTLNEMVNMLTEDPAMEIEIRGYTDDTGDFASNQLLSERRAYAVRKYLIDHGINWRRLRATGYGERNPIANNLKPEGRAANRRIEFVRTR